LSAVSRNELEVDAEVEVTFTSLAVASFAARPSASDEISTSTFLPLPLLYRDLLCDLPVLAPWLLPLLPAHPLSKAIAFMLPASPYRRRSLSLTHTLSLRYRR
jgi:hypothetical protein